MCVITSTMKQTHLYCRIKSRSKYIVVNLCKCIQADMDYVRILYTVPCKNTIEKSVNFRSNVHSLNIKKYLMIASTISKPYTFNILHKLFNTNEVQIPNEHFFQWQCHKTSWLFLLKRFDLSLL